MEIVYAVSDPELGCTSFTVEQVTCTRTRSGTDVRSRTVRTQGCIHPGTPETLQLLPKEERNEQFIVIYTDYPLSTGTYEASGASSYTGADRIRWNSRTWRVVRVRDWQCFGYVQALAVLAREDPPV